MSEPTPPPPPAQPTPSGPPPGPPPAGGSSDNRSLMIVLSYLGFLALIPFIVEKDDTEVQWHAKHGLVLLAAEFILCIGLFLVTTLLGQLLPIIGCISCFLPMIFGVGIMVLHVMCILKGVKGERLLIPGVSEFADKF